MTVDTRPLVVIGVGNVLLGDDGVGVRVVEALGRAAETDPGLLPAAVRLVDGGTLGLDLLDTVRGSRGLIVVDAVRLGGAVGDVRLLGAEELEAQAGGGLDTAAAGVGELLAVAGLMRWLPPVVTLVGIEVGDLDVGVELTPAVAAAIPGAAAAVRRELRRMRDLPDTDPTGGEPTRPLAGATT